MEQKANISAMMLSSLFSVLSTPPAPIDATVTEGLALPAGLPVGELAVGFAVVVLFPEVVLLSEVVPLKTMVPLSTISSIWSQKRHIE